MNYSRLLWTHSSPDEPREILCEYDSDGWESRKVEIFPDGSVGFADAGESAGGTRLSLIPRTPDDEVVADPEFQLFDLTEEEFEQAWSRARQAVP